MQTKVSANREGMSISLKHTHEIMEAIRGKTITKAVDFLKLVQKKKAFVPFKKYPSKGHKAGVPAGYPLKASKSVISILNELKSNAKNAGGDSEKIVVSGYALGRGGYPRYRGGGVYRHGKRTNLRIFGSFEAAEKQTAPEKPAADENKTPEPAVQNTEESKDVTKENT